MIDYEKYYQKGGSYLIPTEIFDELLEENQELKKVVELYSKSLYNAELTKYKEVINKAIEFIKAKYEEDSSQNNNYVPLEYLNLKNCSYERSLQVLDILKEVE